MDSALTVIVVFAVIALALAGALVFQRWWRVRRPLDDDRVRTAPAPHPGHVEVVEPPRRGTEVRRVEERRESVTRSDDPRL